MERGTRSLSDLGVRREGKRDRDQNLCKFEANSELFNENLRGFWPISAFPQQNHPKSDRLLGLWIWPRWGHAKSCTVSEVQGVYSLIQTPEPETVSNRIGCRGTFDLDGKLRKAVIHNVG
uniref:Uncharacterized protein n=1 Tax=Candidatus Kentrum sp. DK TaxID=2126562 RepID=A0A450TLG6_9GAMM|nr:MAG: hypothetical protein BECKDK2373C_GA0170839_11866 [Candidatus Kentron sp. DK]